MDNLEKNAASIETVDNSSVLDAPVLETENTISSPSLPVVESKQKRNILITALLPVVIVVILILLGVVLLGLNSEPHNSDLSLEKTQPVNDVDLEKLPKITFSQNEGDASQIIFNNKVVSGGGFVFEPSIQPVESVEGQIYYDRDSSQLKIYNGDEYFPLLLDDGQELCYVNADCGFLTVGDVSEAVTSINSFSGEVNLQGTQNQVSVDNSGSNIIISLPQNINTTSSPVFNGVTVSNLNINGDAVSDITGSGLILSGGILQSSLGVGIDSSEIVNNTILFEDIASNSCTNGQVVEYNGSAWVCGVDDVGFSNLTITGSSGVPQPVSSGDTITLAAGTNITTTAGATDTVTIAVVNAPTFSGQLTANGNLLIEAGDTFTFNSDVFTDLTGAGLQINAGSLETILGNSIESAEITNGTIIGTDIANSTVTNANLINSQLAVNNGSGIQGGGNISLGGSRALSLGNLTSDWVQAGSFDIVLNNASSELRILESSGGIYYGEFDVTDLNATRLYTFPDSSGEVSLLGQTIDNSELTNNSVTINTGSGLSGGALVALGGSVSLSSNLGDDISSGEIVDDSVMAVDLNTTNVLGAGVDGYVYTYNNATGNFTLVNASTIGGVTSLNSLTGALNITGNMQISVTPAGSSIALAIPDNSLTSTQIGGDAVGASELASSGVSAGTFGTADSVSVLTVDADGRITSANNTSIAIAANQVTSGTLNDARLSSNVALLNQANVFTAAGTALTVNNNATISGVLTVGDLSCSNCLEASNLATGSVETAEILDNTITAVDLDYTNVTFGVGQDNYLLTYDYASGGFTWVDSGSVGTTLTEAQVESYIFDADNTGTLSSGTLALNSLSYTGNLTVAEGGTGITSAGAAGGVFYSTGTAFANTGVGTSGQCLLSAGAGIPSWGNCGGSGAGAVTLQVAYDNGNSITTTNARDLVFALADTATDSNFLVNIAATSTGKAAFQLNGTDLLRIDANGIDLLDVDTADFTGATVTFDGGEIDEAEIAQNSLDDSEIEDDSLTAASLANDSVATGEVLNNSILEVDLNVTNAPTDTYVLTFDTATGGFTWVSQASVAGAGGVTSLNGLTGGLNIVGNSQIGVSAGGSSVNLSVQTDSIGNSQLAFDTGQHLTTTSAPTFAGVTTNGQLIVNRNNDQIALMDADTAAVEWTITTVSDENLAFWENGTTQRLLLSSSGDLTVNGDINVSGGNITVGTTNISEIDISIIDDGSIDLAAEVNNSLPVSNGGTGVSTLPNGVLFGNGTSPITSTGVLSNGQLLIGDGSGNPTIGTLASGSGISVVNGAGTITISSVLGTDISGSEIIDNTIEEVDLEVTNAPTNGYVLSYDSGTGGFTWISGGAFATDEATVESYIFDADNTGTLSSGTLALNSLNYTGNLTVAEGGTGITSAGAAGGVFYSTGTAFANTGVGTSGQCLLSNGTGAPSWASCGGGGGPTTLQVAYDNGNTIMTTDNRNITFNLADTSTDSDFIIDLQGTGSQFEIQDGGVTNLVIDGAGNLGIGAAPGAFKLDVTGSARVTNDLSVNGNATLGDTISDYTTVNGRLVVLASGANSMTFDQWSATNTDIDGLLPGTSAGSILLGTDSRHTVIGLRENDAFDSFSILSGGGDYNTNTTFDTVVFNAQANGNVGIGASSPASRLHITGAVNTSASPGSWVQTLIVDNLASSTNNVTEFRVAGTRRGSIRVSSGNNIIMQGAGSGAVYLSWDEGTGGVIFGNGAGGSVGSVTSAGVANFNGGLQIDGNTVIDDGAGWHRSYGNTGWYNGTHTVGWYSEGGQTIESYSANAVDVNSNLYVRASGTAASVNGESGAYTRIHHNGSNGYIDATIGNLYLRTPSGFTVTNNLLSTTVNVPTGTTVGANHGTVCWYNTGFGWDNYARCSSTRALKDNIQDLSLGLDAARQLRPVTFNWKADGSADFGFIAEEVEAINPILAEYGDNGELTGVRYLHMTALSINAVKQLDLQVQSNTTRINNAENRLAILESTTTNLTKQNLNVTNQTTTNKLYVIGTATVTNLYVTGTTDLSNLKVDRIISKGNTPTAVLGTNTAGLGATYTIEGNDTAGTVSIATTQNNPAGEQLIINFTKPYTETPRISLTPLNAVSAGINYFVIRDKNSFTVNFIDAPVANVTYSFDYQIIQ